MMHMKEKSLICQQRETVVGIDCNDKSCSGQRTHVSGRFTETAWQNAVSRRPDVRQVGPFVHESSDQHAFPFTGKKLEGQTIDACEGFNFLGECRAEIFDAFFRQRLEYIYGCVL